MEDREKIVKDLAEEEAAEVETTETVADVKEEGAEEKVEDKAEEKVAKKKKFERTTTEKEPNANLPAWVKPLVTMAAVCVAGIVLLVVANIFTKPLIEQSQQQAALAQMQQLVEAPSFEDVTPEELPGNITAVYKAAGEAGYVIGAEARGYKSPVPVLVGFDAEGKITGVIFGENHETAGLGQNISTSKSFAAQFAGLTAEEISIVKYGISPAAGSNEIQALAGATVSTNGAVSAINAAINYYSIELMGGIRKVELPEGVLESLMPSASGWTELELDAEQVEGIGGAYLGDDGTYVLVAMGKGYASDTSVTVAVAMQEDGTVTGLWADTSKDTEGIGSKVDKDTAFLGQFEGGTGPFALDPIQEVAGATETSKGVIDAVNKAVAALPQAKEAA